MFEPRTNIYRCGGCCHRHCYDNYCYYKTTEDNDFSTASISGVITDTVTCVSTASGCGCSQSGCGCGQSGCGCGGCGCNGGLL